jgi:serine/threonine-protein kinase
MSKTIDPARWRTLSPFLDQALELTEESRAAWLNALRLEQPTLAAEVEALLVQLRALDEADFLKGDPSTLIRGSSPDGQTLGPYTLESAIGHGGMGSVWLARRSDGRFEGNVAIKLLSTALVGHNGEERFRREGRVLARLTHPNIARIMDAGVSSAGTISRVGVCKGQRDRSPLR